MTRPGVATTSQVHESDPSPIAPPRPRSCSTTPLGPPNLSHPQAHLPQQAMRRVAPLLRRYIGHCLPLSSAPAPPKPAARMLSLRKASSRTDEASAALSKSERMFWWRLVGEE